MSQNPIQISPDLSLPLDVCTQALALLGMRGVGKTHTLTVLCEELIGAGAPVAILDPLGVLWGLRSSKDGKKPGLSVVVMGGEHGDVPLEPTSGRVIADWLVAERHPCVLDLSGFRKTEQRRFVTDFGVRLYEANREPLHLVVDEADLFAPQRPRPDEMAMLGCFEDLVRRGRARGIGISLATQRPAVIHKDVLTQVGVLIALRVVGPQDRKAIEDWIEYHGSAEERKAVLSSLGSLPIGTAYFWSPGWLGMLKKVRVRDRQTFDSSATPKLGSKRVAPQQLAPVDIEALRTRIADTIERAAADDPKALRARIAELEEQLSDAAEAQPAPEPERVEVEVPVVTEDQLARLEVAVSEFQRAAIGAVEQARDIVGRLPTVRTTLDVSPISAHGVVQRESKSTKVHGNGTGDFRPDPPVARPTRTQEYPAGIQKATNGAGLGLSKCARAILTALVQHGRPGLSLAQAAIIAGYASDSGGVRNAAGELRSGGFVAGSNDALEPMLAGRNAVTDAPKLPTGRKLAEYWYGKLAKAEAYILKVVVDAYPKPVALTDAAEECGYAPDSGGVRNAAGKLRTLMLVSGSNAGMTADKRLVG